MRPARTTPCPCPKTSPVTVDLDAEMRSGARGARRGGDAVAIAADAPALGRGPCRGVVLAGGGEGPRLRLRRGEDVIDGEGAAVAVGAGEGGRAPLGRDGDAVVAVRRVGDGYRPPLAVPRFDDLVEAGRRRLGDQLVAADCKRPGAAACVGPSGGRIAVLGECVGFRTGPGRGRGRCRCLSRRPHLRWREHRRSGRCRPR